MGNIFSSAPAYQRRLIDPKLVAGVVSFSAVAQYIFFGMAMNRAFDLFKHEGMPPGESALYLNANKEVNGGPKYLATLNNSSMEMPLALSLGHQMGVAQLYQIAMQQKVSPFPMLYYGALANIVLAALAWRIPTRMLAYAEEVHQGNVMVFAHLREIVEGTSTYEFEIAIALGTTLMSMCIWSLRKQPLPWIFKKYPIFVLAAAAFYGLKVRKIVDR